MASVGKLIVELEAKGVKLTKAQLKQLEGQGKKTGLSLKQMAIRMGAATVATVAMQKAISGAIRVGMNFEQSMANVKAITGATGVEFAKLEKTAKQLGSSTKFTASQVAGLQTEFGKLGFSTKEIIGAQSATLALAAATNTELPRAAEVAGATLRGFGIDAQNTGRVTDVMALSFSKSALDMERFAESMKFVAPVAKSAGFSVEGTTAVLAKMADVGIHGSLAGTALKNIFGDLAGESTKLSKRLGGPTTSMAELAPKLQKLKAEGFGLTEALDLVGRRSAPAFLALVEGSDDLIGLTTQFEEAGGAAQRMADIQLDTFQGKVTEMNSALEGLGITLFEMVDGPLESSVVGFTEFIKLLDAETIKSYGLAIGGVTTAYIAYTHGATIATLATKNFNKALARTPWGLAAIAITGVIAKTIEYSGVFKEATEETLEFSGSLEGVNKQLGIETNQNIISLNIKKAMVERNEQLLETLKSKKDKDEVQIKITEAILKKDREKIANLEAQIEKEKELIETKKQNDDKSSDSSVNAEQMDTKLSELDQFFMREHEQRMVAQGLELEMQEAHFLALAQSEEERTAVEQIFANKRKDIKKDEVKNKQKLELQLVEASSNALGQFAGMQKASARMQQIAATVDAYRTINRAMSELPFPTNLITSATVGATAFANVMAISKSIGEFKTAATGADYVTNGPEMLMVGENPGGRERVQVTPLSSPNIDGPQGGGVTVNVSGNVMSQDFVEGELSEAIKEAVRKGADIGVS